MQSKFLISVANVSTVCALVFLYLLFSGCESLQSKFLISVANVCVCLDARGDVLSLHNVVYCINLPVVIYNNVSGL